MWRMDDETRQFGDSSHDRTEQMPRRDAPRQYMPGEGETLYGGYSREPYDEPYYPERSGRAAYEAPRPAKERSGSAAIALTTLAILLGLASIVLFFLWRGAETRANQPPPDPVTITQTQTVTTSATGILDGLFRRGSEGQPQVTIPTTLPNELPTNVPTEIPPEYRDQAEDIVSDLQRFLNDLFASQ